MPIRVHCPNGCLLRMPADRAGKIVRCPGCKAVIALPLTTESEQLSGRPIPIRAQLVQNEIDLKENQTRPSADNLDLSNSLIEGDVGLVGTPNAETAVVHDSASISSIDQRLEEEAYVTPGSVMQGLQAAGVEIDSTKANWNSADFDRAIDLDSQFALPPQILSPLQLRQIADESREKQQKLVDNFDSIYIKKPASESNSASVIRDLVSNPGLAGPANSESWRLRLQEANSNRITLTKALAAIVFVVGIINAAPALFHWYQSWSAITSVSLPRWIYFQAFVAGLHFVYALFIFQVSDWSSLRAVSVAMLVFAFGFGVVSTALLMEGGHGAISNFFSLSHLMVPKATIWTVSMLCLATLVAYICGKEANDWKRAEQLLVEILNKSP